MDKWTIDGYQASLILDEHLLEDGETEMDLTAARYFGLGVGDEEDKRFSFYYEGREYPSYGENSRNPVLSLSKALTSRLIGVFPDYKEYFSKEENKDAEDVPKLLFDKKSSDEFLLRLYLPWNKDIAVKQNLFDFFGVGTSLGQLKDAYDIVYIRELFDNMDNRGYSDAFMVSGKVKKYLEKRFDETGEIDRQSKRAIEDIKQAGLDDVLAFLMEEQYARLAEEGYISLQQVGDHFMFKIEPALLNELTTDDRRFIIKNMDNKLEAYFQRQDAPSLSESLDAFMFDYGTFFNKDFRYSFKDVITDSIPAGLENLGLIDLTKYDVRGFPGKDDWAEVPYISINDLESSRLRDTGLYIAYILNKDKQLLYLALLIGYLPIEDELKAQGLSGDTLTQATAKVLAQTAGGYRNQMSFGTFSKDTEKVELSDPRYQSAVIAYKLYSKMAPSDETVKEDIKELLELYEEALTVDPSKGFLTDIIEETEEIKEESQDLEETEIEETTEPEQKQEVMTYDVKVYPTSDGPDVVVFGLGSDFEEEIKEPAETELEEEFKEDYSSEGLEENLELPLEEELAAPAESFIQEEELEELETEEEPVKEEPKPIHSSLPKSPGMTNNIGVTRPMKHHSARTKKIHPESIISQQAIDNVRDLLSEPTSSIHSRRQINLEHISRQPELIDFVEPENTSEVMHQLEETITAHGYNPANNLVKDLYLSLKTYPLAALIGSSGSGMDTFVRLYAKALGATFENGRFLQTRVKNTKNTVDKMFGYYNPYNALFTEGVLTDFILHAVEEPDAPFFIYLKDLPLSKQEDFLGELMTIYDTRRRFGDEVITDPILRIEQFGNDEEALSRYNGLYLPDNLFIIAGLSREDYDERELSLLDHVSVLNVSVGSLKLEELVNAKEPVFYGSQFLHGDLLSLAENESEKDMIRDVIVLLEAINSILGRISAQIGPRERDEICLFLLYNAQERLLTQDEALDLAILQKIIPRIYGKGNQIESVISDLFKICAGTRSSEAIRSYPGEGGLFPNSARKLSQMIKNIDEGLIASVFS